MGDDNDSTALSFHFSQDIKKLFSFLRSKNRRRLVKNKYFSTPVKHFQYLNCLLFADGHIVYLFVRVNFKTKLFRYLFYLISYSTLAFKLALCACHNVVCGGEHLHKLEVLMYHAYAKFDRIHR